MSWWTSQRLHPKVKNKFIVVFGSDFFIPSVKSLNKPKVEFDTKEYRLINHTFNYPGNAKWQPITIKFVDMNGDINPAMRTEFFDTSAFLWQIMNNTGYRYPYHNVSNFRENHYRKENQTGGDSSGHWIGTKIDDEAVGAGWRTITTPEKSSTIANSFGAGLSDKPDFLPASAARQRISIYQIDPDGYTVELWHLINPIVKSVGWGDLDYTSDEPVEYELQVVYDWAVLDRKAIGKKPTYDAQSFSKFMKTIYVENEIDLDGDLEDKINKLKEQDELLDSDEAAIVRERQRLDSEILEAKMIADPAEREEALNDLLRDAQTLDLDEMVLEAQRQEQLAEQESILEEASKIDDSLAEILENEFRQELNIEEEAYIASQNADDSLQEEIEEEIYYAEQAQPSESDPEELAASGRLISERASDRGTGDPMDMYTDPSSALGAPDQIPASIIGDEFLRDYSGEENKPTLLGETIIDSVPEMIMTEEGQIEPKLIDPVDYYPDDDTDI